VGFEKGAGLLAEKDRGEGQSGNRHAEGDKRDRPEVGGRDSHEEEGRPPDRREEKENEDVGDAHQDFGLVGEMLRTELELEFPPRFISFDLGKLVSIAAVGCDRDAEGFSFVSDEFELLWRMNAIGGSGV